MKPAFYEAVATLIGTIIGAGVLAIPYAISKAGFLTGLMILAVLAFASILVYLYVGEVVLRTKGNFQLSGYARKYLGNIGGSLMAFTMIFGIYGALIAYIIGVGDSLAALFSTNQINFLQFSMSSNIFFSLLFFIFASLVVYRGMKMVGMSEMIMSSIVVVLLLAISVLAFPGMRISNLASFDISKVFLPYGVILFALSGAVAIPEIKEQLSSNRKQLRKAIIIGVMVPVVLYLLFSLVTVGVCGIGTTEIATVCLGQRFGSASFLMGNLFAILAMTTSFLSLGFGLKEMYKYDYRIKHFFSWILACVVPLIFFFLLVKFLPQETFYRTISLSGGITMTLEGILVVLMHNKAKWHGERKPEFSIKRSKIISAVLIIIFVLGFVYTLLEFFRIL
ncbi:MAG: aromatic amino acid transport family protein [archaeon]